MAPSCAGLRFRSLATTTDSDAIELEARPNEKYSKASSPSMAQRKPSGVSTSRASRVRTLFRALGTSLGPAGAQTADGAAQLRLCLRPFWLLLLRCWSVVGR